MAANSMQNHAKDWLVRTRNREVLGPFTQRELIEALNSRLFSIEDEIAPSCGQWFSAQTLWQREIDEVTRTSTRNQSFNTNSTQTASAGSSSLSDELTPTPNIHIRPTIPNEKKQSIPTPTHSHHRFAPILTGTVIGLLLILVVIISQSKRDGVSPAELRNRMASTDSESPFVKKVYSLIQMGETKAALKELTQYHEKQPPKDDIEYLIPYAALLITEGESPSRARKFLEQVLSAPGVRPQLKSRAHHWLGYLLLSQDEGDMGESHFLEALQLNPKDAAARFNLGRAYLKQEKYSQALDYLQLAELETPDLWLIHIYKGQAKWNLENIEEARNAFTTAIQMSPDRWNTYLYYSLFLWTIKEHDQARLILRKMLTRDPRYEVDSPPPWGFYQEKVDYNQYLGAFNQVMDKSAGEDREVGRLYISYLIDSHAGNETTNETERLLILSQKGGLLAKVLALEVMLDHNMKATDELKTALNRLPPSLNDFGYYGYVIRAEARIRLGMLNDAQQDLQKALALEPKSAISHWAYASLLKRIQRPGDADSEIKSLLLYHPNYIPAIVPTHNY